MTYEDAKKIIREFDQNETPMGEDFFLYTEAMDFLIHKEQDPRRMMILAAEYAVRDRHDVARKYYEMAVAFGEPMAIDALGSMYYYGKGVEKDLDIAADYAKKAYETDDKWASFFGGATLAKIYAEEAYPGHNKTESRRILEELAARTREDESLQASATEVYEELADLYSADGDEEQALTLYVKVKEQMAQNLALRMVPHSQDGMVHLMEKLHDISLYQPEIYDLYDLYLLLKEPAKVSFRHNGERYIVESAEEDGEMRIHFCGEIYRSVADFIERAAIDGTRIESLYFELEEMEVVG